MAGRWVMASIQTTFAVMPALVYGVAGHLLASRQRGDLDRHAGRLHDAADAALLPGRSSLLGVQVDVQTSLALFDRVFEYLDLPVDIDERETRSTLDRSRACAARSRFDDVCVRLRPRRRADARRTSSFVAEPGTTVAVVGETGAGKTTLGYLVARLYDADRRARSRSTASTCATCRSRRSRATVGVVSQETYLFHGTVRENLRFARPDATDEEIEAGRPRGPDPRPHRVAARGLRHGRRRARLPLLGRREAAARDRPGRSCATRRCCVLDEATSALDVETERAVQEALDRLGRGPHDDRDRPPAVDDPRRRPDRRARPRPDRRARHARRAARARRPLRRARRARRRHRLMFRSRRRDVIFPQSEHARLAAMLAGATGRRAADRRGRPLARPRVSGARHRRDRRDGVRALGAPHAGRLRARDRRPGRRPHGPDAHPPARERTRPRTRRRARAGARRRASRGAA